MSSYKFSHIDYDSTEIQMSFNVDLFDELLNRFIRFSLASGFSPGTIEQNLNNFNEKLEKEDEDEI